MNDAKSPRSISLMIKNAELVVPSAFSDAIENGSIAIDGTRILEIGDTSELERKYTSDSVIDARGKVAIPGLVDAHNHLGNWNMYTVLGWYENDVISQPERLKNVVWPAYTWLAEEDTYDLEMPGYLNAIKTGTTTVSDSFIYPNESGRAALASGLRVDLAPCLNQTVCFPDSNGPEDDLIRTEQMIQKWHNAEDGRIKYRIQPETTFCCQEWFFEECAKLGAKYDVGLSVHAVEAPNSTAQAREVWPEGEIRKMERVGFTGPNSVFYHSCILNDDELDIMAETGTSVVHCPVSNLKRGVVARVPEMLAKGISVGLGVDYPNNDLFNVMRITSLIHSIKEREIKGISARQAFHLATQGGADVLGLGDETGSLVPGKNADIVLLDVSTNTRLLPLTPESIVNMIRLNGSGGDVSDVFVDGRALMRNRTVLSVNQQDVVSRGRAMQKKFIDWYRKTEKAGGEFAKLRMPMFSR